MTSKLELADLCALEQALNWQAQRRSSPAIEEDDAVGAGEIQAQGSRLDAAEENADLHGQLPKLKNCPGL